MRRRIIVLAAAALAVSVIAAPAAAANDNDNDNDNDNYHNVSHAMGANFHDDNGKIALFVFAAWRSPQSHYGPGFGPAVSLTSLTYWGDRVGDDCNFSGEFTEFDYRWSMSRVYLGVDTPCGYLEVTVAGERGRDKHDSPVSTSSKYNVATTAEASLDGEPISAVFDSGSIWTQTITGK